MQQWWLRAIRSHLMRIMMQPYLSPKANPLIFASQNFSQYYIEALIIMPTAINQKKHTFGEIIYQVLAKLNNI